MSNDKQLAVRDNNAQVSTRYNEADIQQEMGILRAAFPRLNAPPEGLRALIIASKFSGLNPFRGEIFYIPGIGISVASKIKAADAIAWAAAHGNTLNIRFEMLTELHPECQQIKLERGDVAEVCIIISSKQRNEYFKWRLQVIDELKALGYQRAELEAELNNRCGKTAPETRAVGIVKAGEKFGDDSKFSRQDRAQKRALQKALNIGGFAAPDTRNYGGVQLQADEPASESTVESPYRVVESGVSGAAEMNYYGDDDEQGSASDLKPASQADRAAVSALLDALNEARDVVAKLGATPTDEQKRAFAAKFREMVTAINAQLALRGLPTITETKVTPAMAAAQHSIDAMIDYDREAPLLDEVIPAQ